MIALLAVSAWWFWPAAALTGAYRFRHVFESMLDGNNG